MQPTRNQIKKWAKLREGKYRTREQAFLAEGEKVVAELLVTRWPLECVLLREDRKAQWKPADVPCYLLKERDFQKLSQDKEPEGIMAVAKRCFPSQLEIDPQGRYILINEISNPNNLGAILRTAHWFGLTRVIVSENSVDISHPKAVRASMGSLFHLKIVERQDVLMVIEKMQAQGIKVVATDAAEGTPPRPVRAAVGIIFGNESHGLSEDIKKRCDECWHIPGKEKQGSLSLPQAAAITIYEVTREDFS